MCHAYRTIAFICRHRARKMRTSWNAPIIRHLLLLLHSVPLYEVDQSSSHFLLHPREKLFSPDFEKCFLETLTGICSENACTSFNFFTTREIPCLYFSPFKNKTIFIDELYNDWSCILIIFLLIDAFHESELTSPKYVAFKYYIVLSSVICAKPVMCLGTQHPIPNTAIFINLIINPRKYKYCHRTYDFKYQRIFIGVRSTIRRKRITRCVVNFPRCCKSSTRRRNVEKKHTYDSLSAIASPLCTF